MIAIYKYLYAGGFALRTPYDYQKISQKLESQPNVSSCPANFTYMYVKIACFWYFDCEVYRERAAPGNYFFISIDTTP